MSKGASLAFNNGLTMLVIKTVILFYIYESTYGNTSAISEKI